jgi:hypothetical protein
MWNIIKQAIKKKNPKSQRELETVMDDVCSNLSLNTIAENVGIVESLNLINLSSIVFILILHSCFSFCAE